MKNNTYIPFKFDDITGGVKCNYSVSLYHISKEELDLSKPLKPKVYGYPDSCVNHIEDNHIPRICLSKSIQGCLRSILGEEINDCIGEEFYVYKIYLNKSPKISNRPYIGSTLIPCDITARNNHYISEESYKEYNFGNNLAMLVKPTILSVYDVTMTDEYWYLGELNPEENLIVNIGKVIIQDICYSYDCIDHIEISNHDLKRNGLSVFNITSRSRTNDNYFVSSPEFFYNFIPNLKLYNWSETVYNAFNCTNSTNIKIRIQTNWLDGKRRVIDIDTNELWYFCNVSIPYELNKDIFSSVEEVVKFYNNLNVWDKSSSTNIDD